MRALIVVTHPDAKSLTQALAAEVAAGVADAGHDFEIARRIVLDYGITGDYWLCIDGACSLGSGAETKSGTVTCKTGPGVYKKHFLGLSNNVTFFAEQTGDADVSASRYRVVFKPSVILPDLEVR